MTGVSQILYKPAKGWRKRQIIMDEEQHNQVPVAVYGYCPECGAEGVARERRPNGNDCCANGHTYPSRTSNKTPKRTWVGLTDEEREELMDTYDVASTDYAKAIEAKLKEKNT